MRVVTLVAVALAATAVATAGNPPDPRQAQVVATGPGPCGIAARAGSIWVGVYGSGDLLAIDDTSGRIETRVRVGRWACRVAVGPAAVWVTRDLAGSSYASLADRRASVACASTWRSTSSWHAGQRGRPVPATGPSRSSTLPPRASSASIETAPFRPASRGAAVASGSGTRPTSPGLRRSNRQHTASRESRVGTRSPNWPRCVGGKLWVTAGDSMLRVDPTSGAVLARIHVGGTPVEATSGPDGLVWVTDKERSLVFRIDPATNAITDSFRAGRGAYTMARAGDSMWITSFAGSDVRRFDR